MTVQISREYWFSASHRIEEHPRCSRLHGHNYKVTVFVLGPTDSHGMVMDYGDLDQIVKPLIYGLDHRHLVSNENEDAGDPLIPIVDEQGWSKHLYTQASTAECLAMFILERLRSITNMVVAVRVDETPKSSALAAVE